MRQGYAAGCVFCDYAGPSEILARYLPENAEIYGKVFVIEPIEPVTPGHVIVIPEFHVASAAENPHVAGFTFRMAAEWARDSWGGDCNLITSVGPLATQTIQHLHVHVVPRREGDGLLLPWTVQEVIERCTICTGLLDPDDHKTSEHGDGYAHDECLMEAQA